uniref:WD domain, G-beta repeat/DNA polymerase alpha subunit p180 N terminal, putative n=1 Tax=Theileria annulata TaxID=5874 RepID=A0A3B0MYF5_THEAN
MPKVFLPQILWHSKDNKRCDRIYSIHFQPVTHSSNNAQTITENPKNNTHNDTHLPNNTSNINYNIDNINNNTSGVPNVENHVNNDTNATNNNATSSLENNVNNTTVKTNSTDTSNNTDNVIVLRLATGGADEFVHIWQITIHDDAPQYTRYVKSVEGSGEKADFEQPLSIKILARLVGHIGEVNSVRWSNSGHILASGGEDRCIFLWMKSNKPNNLNEDTQYDYEEYWAKTHYFSYKISKVVLIILYRLSNVVNTISWCPDDKVLSVSTEDGHVSLVDTQIEGPGKIRYFDGHSNFAQGVSIDPKNELLASMGSDQSLRVWKRRNQKGWKNVLVLKAARDRGDLIPVSELENNLELRKYGRYVFMSEELKTFFRRLDWSPDGRLLVTPAGIRHERNTLEDNPSEGPQTTSYTLYIFHRKLLNFGIPMLTHQSPTGPFVVVKFCPINFSNIDKKRQNFFNLLMNSAKNKLKPIKRKLEKQEKSSVLNFTKIDSFFTLNNNTTSATANSADNPDDTTNVADAGDNIVNAEEVEEIICDNSQSTNSTELTELMPYDNDPVNNDDTTNSVNEYGDELMELEIGVNTNTEDQVTGEGNQLMQNHQYTTTTNDDDIDYKSNLEEFSSEIFNTDNTCENTVENGANANTVDNRTDDNTVDVVDHTDDIIDKRYNLRKVRKSIIPIYNNEIVKPKHKMVKHKSNKHKHTNKTNENTNLNEKSGMELEEEYDTDIEEELSIPRYVFAAGTIDGSLCFYDTNEKSGPIAVLKNLHLCPITDISWSPDGCICATSSSDDDMVKNKKNVIESALSKLRNQREGKGNLIDEYQVEDENDQIYEIITEEEFNERNRKRKLEDFIEGPGNGSLKPIRATILHIHKALLHIYYYSYVIFIVIYPWQRYKLTKKF